MNAELGNNVFTFRRRVFDPDAFLDFLLREIGRGPSNLEIDRVSGELFVIYVPYEEEDIVTSEELRDEIVRYLSLCDCDKEVGYKEHKRFKGINNVLCIDVVW